MSQGDHPIVVVITGTTASGKTRLGVEIAKSLVASGLNAEVISADSQLVYQGLNIGTAKPTEEEKQGIPHHMIDLMPPSQAFTVAQYQQQASEVILSLHQKHALPIVVGGTGFYLKALLQNKHYPDIPPNPLLRSNLKAMADEQGAEALHQQLALRDPRRAAQLHPNDTFRVIRALEIIEATGQPVPEVSETPRYHLCWFNLSYDNRDVLRERIDQRIDVMLAEGWLEEVRELTAQYGPDAHALTVAHGYPEWVSYQAGNLSYEQALAQVRMNIHQYARRQITWMRHQSGHLAPENQWFSMNQRPFESVLEASMTRIQAAL